MINGEHINDSFIIYTEITIFREMDNDDVMIFRVDYESGDERAEISNKKIDEEQTDVNLSVQ